MKLDPKENKQVVARDIKKYLRLMIITFVFALIGVYAASKVVVVIFGLLFVVSTIAFCATMIYLNTLKHGRWY